MIKDWTSNLTMRYFHKQRRTPMEKTKLLKETDICTLVALHIQLMGWALEITWEYEEMNVT